MALSGFMRLDSTRGHLMLSSAIALLLGLLLFIVFWLDHPFENPLGITYAPFQQSLGLSTQSTAAHDQASVAPPISQVSRGIGRADPPKRGWC